MISLEQFLKLKPCKIACDWALAQPSLAIAWDTCDNSGWMWWLIMQLPLSTKSLSVAYANGCANHVKHLTNAVATNASANAAASADASAYAYAADAYAASTNASAYAAAKAYASAYASAYTYATAATVYTYAGFNIECKWQADFLRTLVLNPFTN